MNENIKKFLDKVEQDQELQKKFSQLRDPEEAYKIAASVQDGFTKEEFVSEMKRLYEEATQDLSDEDLGRVAGGMEVSVVTAAAAGGLSAIGGVAVAITAGASL